MTKEQKNIIEEYYFSNWLIIAEPFSRNVDMVKNKIISKHNYK